MSGERLMVQTLFDLVRRYADAHADQSGVAQTPVPGLSMVRVLYPGALQVAINRPLVAMVLQGRKLVTMGAETFDLGPGDALLISADVPTVSQISKASVAAPYYSLILELDLAMIADIAAAIGLPQGQGGPISVERLDLHVEDVATRLMQFLNRSGAISVLGDGLLREMHYWMLSGSHGIAIRRLGTADSHAQRISRAVALIRAQFAETLRVNELADAAGMSISSFHQHFRAATTLSPLQFQKQLRLIEARRKMMAEGAAIADAAYAVGYESVPQFTREYSRLFNVSPGRDLRQTRTGASGLQPA